jgi:hypothetical protein
MMEYTADSLYESEARTTIYLACTDEDLVSVEMYAWKLGSDRARADSLAVVPSITAIQEASERACDEALVIYIPLDLDRFRDVFTRAWCAGYCSRIGLHVSYPSSGSGEVHDVRG